MKERQQISNKDWRSSTGGQVGQAGRASRSAGGVDTDGRGQFRPICTEGEGPRWAALVRREMRHRTREPGRGRRGGGDEAGCGRLEPTGAGEEEQVRATSRFPSPVERNGEMRYGTRIWAFSTEGSLHIWNGILAVITSK